MLPLVSKADFGVVGLTTRKYMQPGEQDVLLALVDSVQPRVMVEIGVNIGLTAQAVLRHITSIERYIGIDVGRDYQFEIPAQQVEMPDEPGLLVWGDPRFELILRDRATDLRHLACDVIFIDGDHGHEAVRQDNILATEVVVPGGLIIWHDYGNSTVQATGVLDELRASGRDVYHIESTWLAFERR